MAKKRLIRLIIQKIGLVGYLIKHKISTSFPSLPAPRPMIRYIKENNFENKELVGVEIGTYRGVNALNILLNLPIKKLYLIDPYLDYGEYTDKYGDEPSLDPLFDIVKKKLSKFKDKVVFIKKMSFDAINDIPDNVDFVYIDGNHKYEYVKQDMGM
ncbi:MAG: class I SAM-dependent methyltransferase [Nanoarchaeota archaeon]|nr:class I SAM-dependent methyltransferase [Nanoarchaeota archaeon]